MSEIWVYKADGTIQCEPAEAHEISLDEMRRELATLIGAENILGAEERPPLGPVISLCGAATGQINAYRITLEGFRLLMTGIAGTGGFQPVPDTKIQGDPIVLWPTESTAKSSMTPFADPDDRWVPWPWALMAGTAPGSAESARALINVMASRSAVGANPTTLADIVGRRCRAYTVGDPLTLDFVPARVNIELTTNQRINRIWFG